MTEQNYITIPRLAEILGISRIAVYKRIKKGQIAGEKIGRDYVITDQTVNDILGKKVSEKGKLRIDDAVRRTVNEYGSVLKRLSQE
jgi:excisionase family DNA binding protein